MVKVMNRKKELESLLELRGLIISVMKGAVEASTLENYTYGDADGSQSVRRRNPNDLMKWLNEVDAKIEKLQRPGGGIRVFSTRRFGGRR